MWPARRPGIRPAIHTVLPYSCSSRQFLGEYLRSCLCSALLPPCKKSPSVAALATRQVHKRDCECVGCSNLSHRKFVTTFPDVQYWF